MPNMEQGGWDEAIRQDEDAVYGQNDDDQFITDGTGQ